VIFDYFYQKIVITLRTLLAHVHVSKPFICWYNESEEKVETFLIDCDCTNESTDDVAAALDHSLRRVFPSDVTVIVYGQCTDSGGGGTKYALQKALKVIDIASDEYLVSTCSLHNLDPENESRKFKRLEEPVLARWWFVGACACSFKESMTQLKLICSAICNSAPSDSACSKIASCTLHLIEQKVIVNDLFLLCAVHEFFIFPHFKYLQLGDRAVRNTPAFQARHLLLQYFQYIYNYGEISS